MAQAYPAYISECACRPAIRQFLRDAFQIFPDSLSLFAHSPHNFKNHKRAVAFYGTLMVVFLWKEQG
ncbi:hypothetical protein C3433_16055 [Citrobacter freundii]|nr:hypothetical protein C3433_16055 [Citrobacter freundii]